MIQLLRSCPDAFGCVHVHFDDALSASATATHHGSVQHVLRELPEDTRRTLTLTVPETARLLGISVSKAYEAARLGEIPTVRLGTRILVSRRRLQALIDG